MDMDKQISLSSISDELAQVRTKTKEFLRQINGIIPWQEWKRIIKPYYNKGERGNKLLEIKRAG
jgi:IS5 family transposase